VDGLDGGGGRSVLAVPDFRRLWLVGMTISVARWLEMLVIGIVVFQQTGSAFLVAAMTLLRLAPLGLFGALVGVLADRAPRRLTLIRVLAMQAAAVGVLAAAAFTGTLAVWLVALACFVSGLGWAADNPVRRMMVGEAVGPARMGSAMSLDVMANNASRVAGPVIGGTLLAALGPGVAFTLATLFYLVAIGLAWSLRCGMVAAPARDVTVLRDMRETFGIAMRLPRLRAVMVMTMVYNLFAWPCASMIPVIGEASLGLGPDGVGLLASMDGLGALLGAALVALLGRSDRHAAIYLGGTVLYMLGMIGFALAPGAGLAGAALLMAGIGGAGFGTMQATLTYLAAPPELRGRAFGVLSTAIGTGLLGFLQLGLLADLMGAPAATALVATQGLVVLAATFRLWKPMFQPG
jgi:MFS family permease